MIDLTIMTLDSHNHKFSVPVTFTILELKEFIAAQVNVEVVQQRLIFCGRVLRNGTKLANIGINGKVIRLEQKVPSLSTTTSGSSTSTTTNTTSGSGQNAGHGSRGFNMHNSTNLTGTNGIPTAGELPRVSRTENHKFSSRISMVYDMISRGNEVLDRLEHLLPNPLQSSASSAKRAYPEGGQQAEISNVLAGGSTNESSAEQASETLPSSASSEQHIRNDRQTSGNRSTVTESETQVALRLIDAVNKLNDRSQPFNAMYRQLIFDDPRFDSAEGEDGSVRAQTIFDGVSAVMHFISHAYHLISDIRILYNTAPPRSVYGRLCLQENTGLRSANSVTTSITSAPPFSELSASTQTTISTQFIPSLHTIILSRKLGRGDENETPITTDSSSATNPPSQVLAGGLMSNPHRDPYLPCTSHHFEPDMRPILIRFLRAKLLEEEFHRSKSSATSGNSTTRV